jgi:hypothetical protein
VLKVQPLPADVAALLRDYLAGKPAGQPVWGGTWARDRVAAAMLRRDLEAAGIPYAVEGPDGPLCADFHALRHTYLTLGGRAGIDLRTLQELAGHSTPTLTARYSHRRLHDLAGAVEKLPNFLPEGGPAAGEIRATGTDGGPATGDKNGLKAAGAYTPLTQTRDGRGGQLRAVDGDRAAGSPNATSPNTLPLQGVEAGCVRLMPSDARAGDGARTHDSHVGNADASRPTVDASNDLRHSKPQLSPQLAPGAETPPADSDLARVAAAWPHLPPHIKAAVLALVGAAR